MQVGEMDDFFKGDRNYLYIRVFDLNHEDFNSGHRFTNANNMLRDLSNGLALYEELTASRRIYFDIDGLEDQHPIIYVRNFLKCFIEWMGLKNVTFAMTINHGSRHPGKGFHIVLNKVMFWKDMQTMVRNFLEEHQQYKNVVDQFVYNEKQLMRMPYSGNAIVGIKYKNDNSWEMKKKIDIKASEFMKYYNKYDFHSVIMGKLDDLMIQNVAGCERIILKNMQPIIHPLDEILINRWLEPAYNKSIDKGIPCSFSDSSDDE